MVQEARRNFLQEIDEVSTTKIVTPRRERGKGEVSDRVSQSGEERGSS